MIKHIFHFIKYALQLNLFNFGHPKKIILESGLVFLITSHLTILPVILGTKKGGVRNWKDTG